VTTGSPRGKNSRGDPVFYGKPTKKGRYLRFQKKPLSLHIAMMRRVPIKNLLTVLAVSAAMSLTAACGGKLGETVFEAQKRIFNALKSQGIYERNNLPIDNPPAPEQIKGWFDVMGGAYRHITNEDRVDRNEGAVIARGDSISFRFDARIFSGNSYDNMQTFYTNIGSRIQAVMGNNPNFDNRFWPDTPLKIKVGEDPRILRSLQEALVGCVAGGGEPADGDGASVASDEVRVYLTPDIAFGDRTVYNVPARSSVVFEITDIQIIDN
jgi:hypothetical protein